jgi:hypothetical protein
VRGEWGGNFGRKAFNDEGCINRHTIPLQSTGEEVGGRWALNREKYIQQFILTASSRYAASFNE